MKSLFLLAILVSVPLYAQLELPEYLFTEEVADEKVRRVESGHKDLEAKPAEKPEAAKQTEEQRMQILQMMNTSEVVVFGNGARGGNPRLPDNTRQIQRLMGGGEEVAAHLSLLKGAELRGLLANQVMRVEAAFGSVPLRLGQLERIQRQEDGSFLFELRGGDLLQGKPQQAQLTLRFADGARRVVSMQEINRLEISPAESEAVSP